MPFRNSKLWKLKSLTAPLQIMTTTQLIFVFFIESFYDILPPSSTSPAFKEILIKLSCFISLCVSVSVCWSVFISICLILYSKLHCLFNFITQSLNLCCEAMIHDWSEGLGIAERKRKFDKLSDKRNLKLESDSDLWSIFNLHPRTKNRKTNILTLKTEIVNLQLLGEI